MSCGDALAGNTSFHLATECATRSGLAAIPKGRGNLYSQLEAGHSQGEWERMETKPVDYLEMFNVIQ